MRPPGQGRLRQHNHRTTKSESFWEDGGHADVATGRGVLSLRSFVGKALALFLSPAKYYNLMRTCTIQQIDFMILQIASMILQLDI
ncbi:hypothetical protein PBF_04623 [Cytobacillus firmus DS1]|uniref:Uncharacterized protein n=1 Tax=Cytobacillus firmus DS1 TaxID=1307436 RepID=W7KXB7_CYTFI|nr:hypothetical protein PBF_04623 [Cytobacillus firmus DS1]